MLLDEPTTHLDIDGVRALTTAFKKCDGTICFISHDLYFIKEIADCIMDVNAGEIKIYSGGLEYYLEKRQQLEGLSKNQKGKAKSAQRQSKNRKKEKNQESKSDSVLDDLKKQHKDALKRISQIKNEIKKLEKEKKELETESYVKARQLSKLFDKREPEVLKEYGKRLKYIQSRLREIESIIKDLNNEREKINKS